MITVSPQNEEDKHDLQSTNCICNCDVEFSDGEMIIIHNLIDINLKTKWITSVWQ